MSRVMAIFALLGSTGLPWTLGCSGTEHALFEAIDKAATPPDPHAEQKSTESEFDAAEPVEPMDASAVQLPDVPPSGMELDPDASFEWKETLPGKGTCREGLYLGQFTCNTTAEPGTLQWIPPMTGQVVFTLSGSSEEQVLSFTKGSMWDDLLAINIATVELAGTLFCSQGYRFVAATPNAWSIPLGTYKARLSGSLNRDALIISGLFVLDGRLDSQYPVHCEGAFKANAAP